ncbi:hypothetical protein LF01B1_16200 [Limosilactobacillus fermentum]|uniref:Uncharacterized protein n=1 Tax=Limosilactobacillus fermentum TaxID=1613 RepID=A0ABD0AN25_LIMFE|nr:hypothetical protein LF01B1_16200 [Limosilactobacillus fermentum]
MPVLFYVKWYCGFVATLFGCLSQFDYAVFYAQSDYEELGRNVGVLFPVKLTLIKIYG